MGFSKTAATKNPHDAREEARARMLAARAEVRTWFGPEALSGIDPDVPEVVGEPEHPSQADAHR
jgi:hypothetical protein